MKPYVYKNPVLIDALVADIMQKLESITWLDNIFGLSQMVEREDLSAYKIPAYRTNKNQYESLIPLEKYRNYCFFEQTGEYTKSTNGNIPFGKSWFTTEFSIVFFVNIAKVYPEESGTLQNINAELISFFDSLQTVGSGKFNLNSVTNDFNDIYNNYSIKQTDKQYSMFPYGSIKLSGEATVYNKC